MEQMLLGFFANFESNKPAFQSLTTIYEKVSRPAQWRESFFSDFEGVDDKEHLRTILDRMVMDGLLNRDWGAREYEGAYRITDQGVYEASGFNDYVVEVPPNVLLTESSETPMTKDGQFIELEDEAADVGPYSSAWTGLPKAGVLSEEAADRLKSALAVVNSALEKSGATNEEKAQARAFALAIHALADAPEPPADLIWELVSKASQIAGIASFFVSLVALFSTIAK